MRPRLIGTVLWSARFHTLRPNPCLHRGPKRPNVRNSKRDCAYCLCAPDVNGAMIALLHSSAADFSNCAKEAGDLDSDPTKLIQGVEIGKQLRMTHEAFPRFPSPGTWSRFAGKCTPVASQSRSRGTSINPSTPVLRCARHTYVIDPLPNGRLPLQIARRHCCILRSARLTTTGILFAYDSFLLWHV